MLQRRSICLFGLGLLNARAWQAPAATADAAPRFEVVSIKPADASVRPGRFGASIDTGPARLSSRGASLKDLIQAAYGIEAYQVSGGPGWVDSARFIVDAKPASPATREQLLQMLRPLLADRFKLAFHRETKEFAVYALVVAKGGPKLHRLAAGTESEPGKLNRLGRNVDLAWFARYLTRFGSDRAVIDRTGLTGNFNLDVDMEKITAAAAEAANGAPGIEHMFEATANILESQLGLKLQPTKAPIEVLIVDRAERPSAN
jgi:uncharacterized protein (TIGR03435 family)